MRRVRFFSLLATLFLLAAVIVYVFCSHRESSRVSHGNQGQERPRLPPRQDDGIGEKTYEEGEDSSDEDDITEKIPSSMVSLTRFSLLNFLRRSNQAMMTQHSV